MKIFKKMKDGGPDSTVTGYWLIECKSLFSIVLLKFEGKSREAYHTHAFNAVSWVLKGCLTEMRVVGSSEGGIRLRTFFKPSLKPIFTSKDNMHKVSSDGVSWVLSFRGPWKDEWSEINENGHQILTHGRRVKNKS